jgi:alkylation response protein AidB-like acyl-CoA dehydrogenase
MDFELDREQKMLMDELEKFLKKEVEPEVEEADRKKVLRDPEVLKSWFKKLEPFGAINGPIPEKYGGMGLGYLSTGLIAQKLAEYWGSLWGVCMIQTAGARLLSEIENEAVKEKYLPQVCAGDLISCACITEPDVGSNPSDIGTTIDKVDGGYLVNGSKTWISNGSVSDLAFVVATVDKSLGPKGLGIIMVDRRESPYETRELDKLGLRSFPTSELFFDKVLVPEENLVVAPGVGLNTVGRTFELARSLMSCGSIGFGTAAINLAVKYAKERVQWGKKIGQHQLIQKLIYDMRARTDASTLLVYRALSMMDKSKRCDIESSIAKSYSTEAAVATTKECMQIMGGYGLSEEYPAERYYRDASCMTIPDGTTQIQQLIVARDMLGLSAFA